MQKPKRTRPLTNAELAVLSLVAEKDRHGYEIESVIEERGMRNWTEIGFSSIYHILGVLQKRVLVESRLEPAAGKGSPRRVYHVTGAGRRAYVAGVTDALSRPRMLFPLLQQGMAGLPFVKPDDAVRALGRYAESLRKTLAEGSGMDEKGMPAHVSYMFEYHERMTRAELAWVEELARRIGGKI
jgi:DNA-binding PadR family transcriptional regulator